MVALSRHTQRVVGVLAAVLRICDDVSQHLKGQYVNGKGYDLFVSEPEAPIHQPSSTAPRSRCSAL